MKPLVLPEALAGDWTDCLILTYGAELPFFEHYVWRQLSPSCRRRVILMDGRQFRLACERYAGANRLRFVNRRYAIGGIKHDNAAHAKVIMLTSVRGGRLLVGSGNLGMQGYASGGELFTQYDVGPEQRDAAAEFAVVREFVAHIADRDQVLPGVRRYVWQVLDAAPWTHEVPTQARTVLRHNIREPFLAQIEQEVAGRKVEELWVMSPFFDERAQALRQLVHSLRPQSVRLLLQRQTSVDGAQMASVLDELATDAHVLHVRRRDNEGADVGYLHAKLLLIKLADSALCLQGSANLSQLAMLRTMQTGNAELCNMHWGARDAFNHLLEPLDMTEFEGWREQLVFRRDGPDDKHEDEGVPFLLLGAEVSGNDITVFGDGRMPVESSAWVEVDDATWLDQPFTPLQWDESAAIGTGNLTDEQVAVFHKPAAIRVAWSEGGSRQQSNQVFAVIRTAVDHEFQIQSHGDRFRGVSDLELEDKELEELVGELSKTLLLVRDDLRATWRHRGATLRTNVDVDDGAESSSSRMAYEDVNFEAMRSHPRVRQYLYREGSSGGESSAIEVLMSMVLGHVRSLVGAVAVERDSHAAAPGSSFGAGADDDEELAEDELLVARVRSRGRRVRDAFKRFVQRYLTGVESDRFREIVGPVVMAQNYVFFTHLLLELAKKEWFEEDLGFVMDSYVRLWRAFWGTQTTPGYFDALSRDDQDEVRSQLQATDGNKFLLGAVTRMAQVTRVSSPASRRFELRDAWRHMLCAVPDILDTQAIAHAANVSGAFPIAELSPFPAYQELEALAQFQTGEGLARSIESQLGLPVHSCSIERQEVEPPTTVVRIDGFNDGSIGIAEAKLVVSHLLAYRKVLDDRSERYLVVMGGGDVNDSRRLVYNRSPMNSVYGGFRDFRRDVQETLTDEVTPSQSLWSQRLEEFEDAITA